MFSPLSEEMPSLKPHFQRENLGSLPRWNLAVLVGLAPFVPNTLLRLLGSNTFLTLRSGISLL